MRRLIVLVSALAVAGCGPAHTSATGDPAKKVTWSEYQKMDAEQKGDPYVLDNLDSDAKQKLAASQRKTKR